MVEPSFMTLTVRDDSLWLTVAKKWDAMGTKATET